MTGLTKNLSHSADYASTHGQQLPKPALMCKQSAGKLPNLG